MNSFRVQREPWIPVRHTPMSSKFPRLTLTQRCCQTETLTSESDEEDGARSRMQKLRLEKNTGEKTRHNSWGVALDRINKLRLSPNWKLDVGWQPENRRERWIRARLNDSGHWAVLRLIVCLDMYIRKPQRVLAKRGYRKRRGEFKLIGGSIQSPMKWKRPLVNEVLVSGSVLLVHGCQVCQKTAKDHHQQKKGLLDVSSLITMHFSLIVGEDVPVERWWIRIRMLVCRTNQRRRERAKQAFVEPYQSRLHSASSQRFLSSFYPLSKNGKIKEGKFVYRYSSCIYFPYCIYTHRVYIILMQQQQQCWISAFYLFRLLYTFHRHSDSRWVFLFFLLWSESVNIVVASLPRFGSRSIREDLLSSARGLRPLLSQSILAPVTTGSFCSRQGPRWSWGQHMRTVRLRRVNVEPKEEGCG